MDDLAIRLGLSPELVETLRLGLLGRLVLAALLGGLIGLERELRAKPAGLRTNLLICMGAALLMEVSISVARMAEGGPVDAINRPGDPGRIAAQIVSGIGFLGAGTILQSRGSISGLTTAATIWVVAAIGMAVGAGAYVEAVGTAVLVGLSLVLLARVEDELISRSRAHRYTLKLEPSEELLALVESTFRQQGLRVEAESVSRSEDGLDAIFEVTGPPGRHGAAMRILATHSGVRRLSRVS